METLHSSIDRLKFLTNKSFDDLLADLYTGISRPNISELTQRLAATHDLTQFEDVANSAAGSSGLLEFLHLNLGAAINVGLSIAPCRMVRIIAGNPAIMRQMTEWIPDAGSYAPVTILIYESNGEVHVCYDRLESLLAAYDSATALKVAKDLDGKVISLIERATR
jgi:hypothetical protein